MRFERPDNERIANGSLILAGFMLLKEALDQALGDKMGTEERERAAREMKDIPFTSLLKQVLGQDRLVDRVSHSRL